MFTAVAPRARDAHAAHLPPRGSDFADESPQYSVLANGIDLRNEQIQSSEILIAKTLIQIKVSSPCLRCKCTSNFQRLSAGA
jgi:hypothetical protein